MKRCSPVETRKNMEVAKSFASAGMDFVCIPVRGDKAELTLIMCNAMELLALDAEKEERDSNIAINEEFLKDLS